PLPPPRSSTLFPYTTLFRSRHRVAPEQAVAGQGEERAGEQDQRFGGDFRAPAAQAGERRGRCRQVRGCDAHARFPSLKMPALAGDRKSTRLNSSHVKISYAV